MHPLLNNASVFADGLDHPECIAVHPDGSVWAGGEAGQIYRISPDGANVEEVANTGGFILGLAFNPGADWLAICDLKKKCIWKLTLPSNQLDKLSEGTGDHQFNIPNFPVFDSHGNLYITESGDFRKITGKIIRINTNGDSEIWHPGPFNFANGACLSRDENHLYLVVSFMPGVESIEITPDGLAGRREVYCTLPETVPDGCVLDSEGNLYVSCYAPNKIFKIATDRTVSVLIDDWEAHTLSNPTNIAFGGEQLDQLYAANLGRWHITRIKAGIVGLPLASHRPLKDPSSEE